MGFSVVWGSAVVGVGSSPAPSVAEGVEEWLVGEDLGALPRLVLPPELAGWLVASMVGAVKVAAAKSKRIRLLFPNEVIVQRLGANG